MSLESDRAQARALLAQGSHALVFVREGVVLGTGDRPGVADLLDLAERLGAAAEGSAVADKVVGRAAALVFQALGVAAVHAQRISDAGAEALAAASIPTTWDERVAQILNRTLDGPCPFEQAAAAVVAPADALPALRARRAALMAR